MLSAAANLWLTNCDSAAEWKRLDAQAAAIVEMLGGEAFLALKHLHKQASKAVDVGCGTGVATLQIAEIIPSSTVIGLDISSVPDLTRQIAPTNIRWVQGNILDTNFNEGSSNPGNDVFSTGTVDYVFGRMLFLGINDWQKYFSVASQSLKSGGIIEHQDLDWRFYRVGTNECLSDKWDWHERLMEGVEKCGLSRRSGSEASGYMEKAGFKVLSMKTFEFSFVPSHKTPCSQAMGRYVQEKLIPNYPELLRKIMGGLGIAGDELKTLTKHCLQDLASEEGVHQKYTVTVAVKV